MAQTVPTETTVESALPSNPPRSGMMRWLLICLTIIATTIVAIILWNVIEHFLHIVILLVASMILAIVLGPLVDPLQNRGIPRIVSILLIYLVVIIGLVVGFIVFLGPLITQLTSVTNTIPDLLTSNSSTQSSVDRWLQQVGIPVQVDALRQQALDYMGGASSSLLGSTLVVAAGVVGLVTDIFLILAITFYILLDGSSMRRHVLVLLPEKARSRWFFIEATMNSVLGGYIRGQIIVAATVGVAAGVGSALLGVQYPLIIGLLAFVFEFIPLLGPVLGMVPAVLISLFQPFPLVIWVIVYFIVLQQVESNIIVPRISGHAVGLHPLGAMIALIAGFEIGGIGGALLAVPIAGILYVLGLALYSDITQRTELLTVTPRQTAYRSVRQVLRRNKRTGSQVDQLEVATSVTATSGSIDNDRLADLAEDQAELMAEFAAEVREEEAEEAEEEREQVEKLQNAAAKKK